MFATINSRRSLKLFLSWSERFCLVAHDDGSLHIRPLAATLEFGELHNLLDCLCLSATFGDVREVVFDLSLVSNLGPNSTLIWAMLMSFARQARITCRLKGLSGGPAAVASMYRRNRELMALLAA